MMKSRVIPRILGFRFLATQQTNSPTSQNINQADVDHHSSFSNEWWDVNGPMKGLHALNQIRVPLIRDGLISTGVISEKNVNTSNVLQGINILEVGCGAGVLTEPLSRLKANITALDPAEKLIETAKNHLEDLPVKFINESVESHAMGNKGKYDAVVASEVLEHVKDQKSFLSACVESLKPGGSIFITTFNKTQASWLAGIIAAEHLLKLVPENTHDWNQFISPSDVEKILNDLNCSTVLVHGIRYEFWRNAAVWSSCTKVNYALHAVKNDN